MSSEEFKRVSIMSNVVRNQDDKSKLNTGFSNVEVADDFDNSLQRSRSKNLIEKI